MAADVLDTGWDAELESLCDAFEREWQSGGVPRIDEYLTRSDPARRSQLMRELLRIESDWRNRRHEPMPWDEYVQRFGNEKSLLTILESERARAVETEETLSYVALSNEALYSTLVRPQTTRPQPDSSPAIGTLLNGRYELQQEVGKGGMGKVFLALDQRLGRRVAVKLIRPDHWQEHREEMRSAFEVEARLGASLLHPAIATVYDYGFQDDVPFAVFEYLAGQSLRDVLRSHCKLPLEDVLDIVCRLAAALDYAHHKGIVHRDLKPENIRFDEHGQCKILDLGLAKNIRRHDETDWRFVGTPAYASPEQASDAPSDGRADQYALAVITYELLTGRRPFEAKTWQAMLAMHRETQPDSPALHLPTLAPSAAAAILKVLSKNPNDRFASCSEFATALGGQPESIRQNHEVISEASVVIVPAFYSISFKLRTVKTQIALQEDSLWVFTEEATNDRMTRWRLSTLAAVTRWARVVTVTFLNQGARTALRFKFADRKQAASWEQELNKRLPSHAAVTDVAPVDVEIPIVTSTHPNVRMQVLGNCEATAGTQSDAERALRLLAAIEGATGVINMKSEKLITPDGTKRRVAGQAVRTLDSAGRLELISRWYIPEIRRTCGWLLVLICVFSGLMFAGGLREIRSIPRETIAMIGAVGQIVLAVAAVVAIPFLVTIGLFLTQRPQFVRPVAIANSAFALSPMLGGLALLITTLAMTHSLNPQSGIQVTSLIDPILWALVISGILLSRRLWRARSRYLTLAGAVSALAPARSHWGLLNAGFALMAFAYAFGIVVASGFAGYQQAQLALPGMRELNDSSQLFETGDVEGARRLLEKSVANARNNAAVHLDLTRIHLRQNNLQAAVDSATRAIELDPNLSSAYLNRSAAYLRMDRPAEARADADRAIEIDPSESLAYINRAAAQLQLGSTQAAYDDATRAIELDPSQPLAFSNRGLASYLLGRPADAIRDAEETLRLDATESRGYFVRGVARLRLGEIELAVPDFLRAVELDTSLKPTVIVQLEMSAIQSTIQQKFDHVVRAGNGLVSLNPDSEQAYLTRGFAYLELNRYVEARQDAYSALLLDPKLVEALNLRASARLGLNDSQGCIDDCTRAIALNPASAQAYLIRGRAHEKLGQNAESEADFEKARMLDP